MLRLLAAVTALLLQTLAARAQEPRPGPRVGEVYEIRAESESTFSYGEGSSGNSSSRNMLVERVIAISDTGAELEFDLPADVPAADRARSWQFPVRVLRPPGGPLQLLNGPELERRVERWLQRARLTREACGHWYFTWDAFQIECDPQSVIQMLATFDLRPSELRDGAPYQTPGGRGSAVLRREARGANGEVFVAEMEVDAEAVRRDRARSDIVVAEITRRETLALDAALRAHMTERISGTIRTRFESDEAGHRTRRITVIELVIEEPNGQRETRTATETVERRLVSPPPS